MSGGTGTPGFGSLLSGSGATPYNPQAGTPSTGGAGQPAGGLMGAMGGKGGQGGQQAQLESTSHATPRIRAPTRSSLTLSQRAC
jgi:hypothetical protein